MRGIMAFWHITFWLVDFSSTLKVGDIVQLVYGDGNYLDFEVVKINEYQALQPDSPYSNCVNLNTGEELSANNLFIEVCMGDFHTTLQTCITKGNETGLCNIFSVKLITDFFLF